MSLSKDRAPKLSTRRVIAPLTSLILLSCAPAKETNTPPVSEYKRVGITTPENLRVGEISVMAAIDPSQQAAYDALTAKYETQKFDTALEASKMREALAYINSAERNDLITTVTNAAAGQITGYAQSNKLGNFNFYNAQTGQWGRMAYNEGLGSISHVPGTGGYEGFVGATGIYQNLDGTLDSTKDNHGIFLSVQGQPMLSIQLTSYPAADGTAETGWQVSVVENPWTDHSSTINTDRHQAQELSAVELQAIDNRAMDVLKASMDVLAAL